MIEKNWVTYKRACFPIAQPDKEIMELLRGAFYAGGMSTFKTITTAPNDKKKMKEVMLSIAIDSNRHIKEAEEEALMASGGAMN